MGVQRYLQDDEGKRVDSRPFAAMLSFGWALLVLPLCVVSGVLWSADAAMVGVCGLLASVAILVLGVAAAWVIIFRVHKRLKLAVDAWSAGDPGTARTEAQGALRIAFRADFRTKGLHVLGLAAEAEGDFEAAEVLFARARKELPVAAAPIRKKRATALIGSHRALALLVLGRGPEAVASLEEASASFAGKSGFGDALLDDAKWGLGALSINGVLEGIEKGRDALRFGLLVRALILRAQNDARGALELLDQQGAHIREGLLPREQVLLDALVRDLRSRLDAAFRGQATPPTESAHEAWAAQVLGLTGR